MPLDGPDAVELGLRLALADLQPSEDTVEARLAALPRGAGQRRGRAPQLSPRLARTPAGQPVQARQMVERLVLATPVAVLWGPEVERLVVVHNFHDGTRMRDVLHACADRIARVGAEAPR